MKVGPASLRILPMQLVLLEAIDGWRIRIALIEFADLFRDIDRQRDPLREVAHENVTQEIPRQMYYLPGNPTDQVS